MDSNKIKSLAFGAREALRAEVAARIDAVLAEGSSERLDQRHKVRTLESAIEERGRDAVVESSAYTWFNRLCALRFMDANGYTPVPVVTPRPGSTQPAILADAAQGVFDPDYGFSRLVRDRVQSILAGASGSASNRSEAAYGELLIAVCEYYSESMPYLFGEAAASSLAMPRGLLAEDSILQRIVEDMDDEACASVEVLGWLYQFYVTERKDEFFASGRKATADDIAPATQLFTPNWIVRYLVENSLGRLWMLNNPDSLLVEKMDYYIVPEGEIEDFVSVYSPEELTLCDPACGSGHILVYAFDLLYEIYLEEGYLPEDIPSLILQNNLFGMEIDARAAEIAKFALEMKARGKDSDFFRRGIDANITVLESIVFEPGELDGAGLLAGDNQLQSVFAHMGEIGSLYVPDPGDSVLLDDAVRNLQGAEGMFAQKAVEKLEKMKSMVELLSNVYDCVVANPPYMGSGNLNLWMRTWVKDNYPNEKADLCTCFIRRGLLLTREKGYASMITMQSWMFEASFEYMRIEIISKLYICNLLHLGIKTFKEIGNDVVQTCAFSICKVVPNSSGMTVIKLDDVKNYGRKPVEFFNTERCYHIDIDKIRHIPGTPITAYWASNSLLEIWASCDFIEQFGTYTGSQNVTGNNDRYVRLHWEVNRSLIGRDYWVPYAKGGSFRRYYGNILHVVDWRESARNFYSSNSSSNLLDCSLWYKEGITYSAVTSRGTGFRYLPHGCVFDKGGASIITDTNLYNLLGIFNSRTASTIFMMLNPSVNLQVRDIKAFPLVMPQDERLQEASKRLVEIARSDWDSSEISLDFQICPLLNSRDTSLSQSMVHYGAQLNRQLAEAKELMERIDGYCCQLYGIDHELLPKWEERDFPVRSFNLSVEARRLISYGVGCIMGRYSVYKPGLILADAGQTLVDFEKKVPNAPFRPDKDAIVPVLDGEWFTDDMVAQFRKWLEVTYGKDSLEDNIDFIEEALGKSLRAYFVKDFYKDHCAMYQVTGSGKRPIYWMFSSPKGSFKALVYMHRYTSSTLGQILTGYLREYVEKLNASIGSLDLSDSARDKRQADKYRTMVRELADWERDVIYPLANEHISIDLDDGVKANYNKFPHALVKVAGLSSWK